MLIALLGLSITIFVSFDALAGAHDPHVADASKMVAQIKEESASEGK